MFDLNRTFRLASGALFARADTWQAYLPEAGDWKRTALLFDDDCPTPVWSILHNFPPFPVFRIGP